MGWVTYSIRKKALKARRQSLNYRLMQIQSELQSFQSMRAYKADMLATNKQEIMNNIDNKYNSIITSLSRQATNSSNNEKTQAQINQQITEYQQQQKTEQQYYESLFTRLEQQQTREAQRKEQYLEMQQEDINTQLEAAKAEYDQYKEAISNSIDEGKIELR